MYLVHSHEVKLVTVQNLHFHALLLAGANGDDDDDDDRNSHSCGFLD